MDDTGVSWSTASSFVLYSEIIKELIFNTISSIAFFRLGIYNN